LVGTFTAAIKKSAADLPDAADAPAISGKIALRADWQKERIAVAFVAKGKDDKRFENWSESIFRAGVSEADTALSSGARGRQEMIVFNDARTGLGYKHVGLPPEDYLIYVSRNGVTADYKKVAVKEGDLLTVDLAIDPSKAGRVVATLSAEESVDQLDGESFYLVPIEFDASDYRYRLSFRAGKGDKSVTIEGVPAGKYLAIHGKSEAKVEVFAGRETAATLVRTAPKTK